jgi:hypothetical protein
MKVNRFSKRIKEVIKVTATKLQQEVKVKERPVIFSGEMVRAILEGRKSMTRRVIKPQLDSDINPVFLPELNCWQWATLDSRRRCPYGAAGSHLWVRETFALDDNTTLDKTLPERITGHPITPDEDLQAFWLKRIAYRATDNRPAHEQPEQWKPSIFMPRWASRISLEITGVRAEQLQDISEADARAEGIRRHEASGVYGDGLKYATAQEAYRHLWDSINGKKADRDWQSDPWVWVLEFRRVD